MTIGKGGKYDDVCEMVLLTSNAEAVALIVVGGNRGSGFSVSSHGTHHGPPIIAALRAAADQIERDLRELERRKS